MVYSVITKEKKKGYHNSLRGKYCSGRIFSEEILEIVTVHFDNILPNNSFLFPHAPFS